MSMERQKPESTNNADLSVTSAHTDTQTTDEVLSAQIERTSSANKEKAMRYLERKQSRQERISQEMEAVRPGPPQTPRDTPIPEIAIPTVADTPVSRPTTDPIIQIPPGEPVASGTTSPKMKAISTTQSTTEPQKSQRPTTKADVYKGTRIDRGQKEAALAAQQRARYWQKHRKMLIRHLARKYMQEARYIEQRNSQRLWVTVATTLMTLLFFFATTSGTGAYVAYRFYNDTQARYIGQVMALHDLLPRDNLKMYDSKGVLIGQLLDQGMHTSVSISDVSPLLINATVATEDKNFWTNPGIDIPRIVQAAIDDLRSGHVVAGGSTITQQLIKSLIVGDETSILRKLEEVTLTPEVNNYYSKRDILEMYLNSIFYGEQAYGIDAAATTYFGLTDKPGLPAAKQLDLAQSAMLAGLPNSPFNNDPLVYPQNGFQRFQIVLTAMINQGYITEKQAADARAEAQSPHFFKKPAMVNRAPHFFNLVLGELEQQFHMTRQQLSRSDMSVTTTLDITLQDKIQKIMQAHIADLRDLHNATNSAEVLIDFHTGAVISLLGSIDYNNKSIDGQFDVATAYRQPGSSFKPYVYVTAFEQGASPAQAVADTPLTIDLPGGDPPTFSPHNYDLQYHGHMTLRCALQNSLNVPAVKVLQHVGIDNAMKTAYAMGITSYQGTPGYSLVLGGLGVRLLDHTSAYGTFADGGVHVPYYTVNKITIGRNHQTYGHPFNPGKQVISPQLAYMVTNVLSDNQSRLPEFFDCNQLQLYANSQQDCWAGDRGAVRPAAAKTGTTTDFRDNWTMGYTTDYVMGVWAGNDDNTPMIDVTGVQGAAPIWHEAMLVAEAGRPIRDFAYPGGLQRATVTYADGVRTTDWFMPGTVPDFNQFNGDNINNGNNGDILPITNPTPAPGDKNNNNDRRRGSTNAYCPSDFTFAFAPPSNNAHSENAGWW